MGGIYGIFQRNGSPVSRHLLETMAAAMPNSKSEDHAMWLDGCTGLGQRLNTISSEAVDLFRSTTDSTHEFAFVYAARLDNRAEIAHALHFSSSEASRLTDGELIRSAYARWGELCTDRLYGDWSFAVWHVKERRLFLARDHFGITSLYYHADQNIFAFASSRQALTVLKLSPIELDELYLAQVITSWQGYHGERTIHSPIRRLPPAHRLTVTPQQLAVHQYWYLEKTSELHLPQRSDYVDAFLEVFDDAVQTRLLSPADNNNFARIASTLSGGLDSSAVTATAAGFLQPAGKRVAAYTSVPLYDTGTYVRERFGDEFPLAEAMAGHSGNIDLNQVTASNCSPIQAVRQMLQIHNEPAHAASNFFWMLELMKAAQINECNVLLMGQFGNVGVSWTGDIFSQPLAFLLRQIGWHRLLKEKIKRRLPAELLSAWRCRRSNMTGSYLSSSINPDFAERLHLRERQLEDPNEQPHRTALDFRRFLLPGRCMIGAMFAEMGVAHGLEIRDPTADARVLAFTFSVPDQVFMDPATGIDRWLIRAAMKGRVPDEIRLNRNRGRQAGDLVPRLRHSAAEVETTLDELARGPATAYLNIPHMRQAWQMIQTQETPESFNKASTILMRGIMAGLFVNDFYA